MNTENKAISTRQFTILSIIVPILSIVTVYFGLYINSLDNYSNLLAAAGFVLCFDFIYLFYIGNNNEAIFSRLFRTLIIGAVPILIFAAVYINNRIADIVLFTLILALCIFVDLPAALISIASLCAYCALLGNGMLLDKSVIFIFIIFCCIMVKQIKDNKSLVFSAVLCAVFYAILSVVASNFILSKAFDLPSALNILGCIIIFCIFYYVKEHFITGDNSLAETDADTSDFEEEIEVTKPNLSRNAVVTQHDNKVLRKELASTNKAIEKLRAFNSDVTEENNRLLNEKTKLSEEINRLKAALEENDNKTVPFERCIEEDFAYIRDFNEANPKLYTHCLQVANLSTQAASLINCDEQLAYILGIYHEAPRFLGEDFVNILRDKYHISAYIIRLLELSKNKENKIPTCREVGIVLLTDDIITTVNYLKSTQNTTISIEKVVSNAIKYRNEKNALKLAGFTNTEILNLKLYFSDLGGSNDITN